MMRWIKLITALFVLLFLLASCNESDESAADGDGNTNGGSFGDPCSTNADCSSQVCATVDGRNFCSQMCTSNSHCESLMFNSCCDGALQICLPPESCGNTDGDSIADGDNSGPCTQDDMRCRDSDVERCDINGEWVFYRDCAAVGQVCDAGDCTSFVPDGDSSANCNPGERKCEGTSVKQCSSDGNIWIPLLDCPEGDDCVSGECVTPCGEACTVEGGCAGELEYCLPESIGATDGCCVPNCDQDGMHCPRGWECKHGACEPIVGYCRSDSDCYLDEFCDRLIGPDGKPLKEDGLCTRSCYEEGESCPELYKCVEDPNDINYGRCILRDATCTPCSSDAECGSSSYCEIVTGQLRGCCRPKCGPSIPCPSPLTCNDYGHCVVGTGNGDCGGPCPNGYTCDKTFNQCVLDCPSCPQNHCCDAGSAPDCYQCICENPMICGVLRPPCCFGFSCSAVIYGMLGYCI